MKPAILGIFGIVALFAGTVVMATSCSVTHKSGDYACTKQSDCNQGRQCVEGFCVISGAVDASTDSPRGDANQCPAQCTSCNTGTHTCTIDCSAGNSNCGSKVSCPANWNCDVMCNANNSCRNGVSCTGSTSCNVTCSAQNACQNVVCGAGKCQVECSGPSSCKGVTCSNSCACDVTCNGSQSCGDSIQCTAAACKVGFGCSSLLPNCHSC